MSDPVGRADRPLRVAIVGSGPAGFYAAEHLLRQEELVAEVDMFDRLPTPFGLVRAGVAPDHPKIKSVIRVYEKTAAREGFRFFGNVDVGRQVSAGELGESVAHRALGNGGAFGVTEHRRDRPRIDGLGRCAQHVDQLVARKTREVERVCTPRIPRTSMRRRRRRKQRSPKRLPHQPEHQIATCIEIVRRQKQFAEAGLAEVVVEEFRVPAAQVSRLGRLQRCAPAQQIPESIDEVTRRTGGIDRRAKQLPRAAAASVTPEKASFTS